MMWNAEGWEMTNLTKDFSWLSKAFLKSCEHVGAYFLYLHIFVFISIKCFAQEASPVLVFSPNKFSGATRDTQE